MAVNIGRWGSVSSTQQGHAALTARSPGHTASLGKRFEKLICEAKELWFEMAPS